MSTATLDAPTSVPAGPNDDLKGVLIHPVESKHPANIYTPGAGYTYHLSSVGVEEVGGMSMRQLAYLHQNPKHPLNDLVEVECSQQCGVIIKAHRLFAALTACEACCAKKEKEDQLAKAKTYWESICPPSFTDTNKSHAGFPKAQYEATKSYAGEESLLFFGPTGTGKSRLAMWLLKRCLARHHKHVGVLWPEQLKSVKTSHERLELVQKWGRYDLLLMDDSLLTGAQDERITDFLKDLLDYRMRYNRHQIITSQIGGEEYKAQADKFENITAADLKRVDALLRRLREVCRVVSFAEPKPVQDESSF